ncbi:MAG: DUF1800 domain-containing protein [Alphaproteobacteria bacterium]|nr:DUF1800 domain-containing protein [Alphaproteobacteria bacterium]
MSLDRAAIATTRFGLGARPGEIDAASADPKAWLLAQLDGPYVPPAAFDGFASTAAHRENYFYRYAEIGYGLQQAQKAAEARGDTAEAERLAQAISRSLAGYVTWVAENLMIEYGARTNVALTTDASFRERLVRFWSNHLVVPAIKQQSSVIAGAYEREVIRPHVAGRFADMLKASAQNPAMLVFLDNHVSIGPNSVYGRQSGKGLNENLAREILELHTMGVEGGYTQDDVIALAKGITGWSTWPVFEEIGRLSAGAKSRGEPPGSFIFYADWQEPGAQTLLGRTYAHTGLARGEAMLDDLAHRPETARYLAFKLARHFSADDPDPALVRRLADVYLAHDTDLGEMTRALVETEEVWAQAGSKLKQPDDYAISCLRSLGVDFGPIPPMKLYNFETYAWRDSLWAWLAKDTFNLLPDKSPDLWTEPYQRLGYSIAALYRDVAAMGQSPLNAPGPQGWYDRWSDWSGADSMLKRVEWSLALATRHQDKVEDARSFLEGTLGALASSGLKTEVGRAATRDQGIGLVLAGPDFQRR